MNNKYDIVWTSQFKKDYKLAMKRHLDIAQLDGFIHSIRILIFAGPELCGEKDFSARYTDNITVSMMVRQAIYFLPEAIRTFEKEQPGKGICLAAFIKTLQKLYKDAVAFC